MKAKWDDEIDDKLWGIWLYYQRKSQSIGLDEAGYKHLYKWVRKHKPKEVLECGTGKSTIAIALAMYYNGFGRVTSMESVQRWYDMAVTRLPEELAPFVDIILSPVVKYALGHRYEKVPERLYEMVLIDGPNNQPSSDFVWVVARSKIPVIGFVDKRRPTKTYLEEIYGERNVSERLMPSHLWRIRPCFGAGMCEDTGEDGT